MRPGEQRLKVVRVVEGEPPTLMPAQHMHGTAPKRFTLRQVYQLELSFGQGGAYPTRQAKQVLVERLGLTPYQVVRWFQNRRRPDCGRPPIIFEPARKHRWTYKRLNPHQREYLESWWTAVHYVSKTLRRQLSQVTGLREATIANWFQKRRASWKKTSGFERKSVICTKTTN